MLEPESSVIIVDLIDFLAVSLYIETNEFDRFEPKHI
jgi:hypothetical protein